MTASIHPTPPLSPHVVDDGLQFSTSGRAHCMFSSPLRSVCQRDKPKESNLSFPRLAVPTCLNSIVFLGRIGCPPSYCVDALPLLDHRSVAWLVEASSSRYGAALIGEVFVVRGVPSTVWSVLEEVDLLRPPPPGRRRRSVFWPGLGLGISSLFSFLTLHDHDLLF